MMAKHKPILDFKRIPKPKDLCCAGMSGAIDQGWVIPKEYEGRIFFIIPVRNKQRTNIILGRCFTCGKDIYPNPIKEIPIDEITVVGDGKVALSKEEGP